MPLAISQASLANEATDTAKGVTTAAASAASDVTSSQPTVTFGQSFGSYDPVIGVFFYLVIAALSVLTLGVTYLSIRNWQDSTDEKKERASFTKSAQDRAMSEMSAKSRVRRQPKSKSGGRGFGS